MPNVGERVQLVLVVAAVLATPTSSVATPPQSLSAGNASAESELAASGITAVVTDENHSWRFWISFDWTSNTWLGGHTAPTTGILPVTGGRFKIGPSGIVLYDNEDKMIGLVNAFKNGTRRGEIGRGHIEVPPNTFSWTGI